MNNHMYKTVCYWSLSQSAISVTCIFNTKQQINNSAKNNQI